MIRELWQHNRVAMIGFVVALCAVLYFGFQTVSRTIYWNDPAHQDQPLAGWMTPRYVARSYAIPPDVLGPALYLPKDVKPLRRSLDAIAQDNDVTLDQLQDRIDAAVTTWRRTHPEPHS